MEPHRVTFLARLSADQRPKACSWQDWKAWVKSPKYNPCLARERLDDWQVELVFTGSWTGSRGERPKFFKVVIIHEHSAGVWGEFETYEQARSGLRCVLEACWYGAQEELRNPEEG